MEGNEKEGTRNKIKKFLELKKAGLSRFFYVFSLIHICCVCPLTSTKFLAKNVHFMGIGWQSFWFFFC